MHFLQQATLKEKCSILVSKTEISNIDIVNFVDTEHAKDVPIGQDSFVILLQNEKARAIRQRSMCSRRAKSAGYVIENFS